MAQGETEAGTVEGLHADGPHCSIVGVEMQYGEKTVEKVGKAEEGNAKGIRRCSNSGAGNLWPFQGFLELGGSSYWS